MRTIAFMNQKGGVGKTTTAVNVGAILAAEHGRRVLLVDLDPQGNLTDHVGLDPATVEPSIYDVLLGEVRPEAAVRPVHGMGVLPATLDLSGVESELAADPDRIVRLRQALDPLAGDYDFVLIDCPPSLGILTVQALTLAREVLVPMQAEYLALRGLSQLVETVDRVRARLNPALSVTGVVFCMYDGRTNLAREVRREVESYFPGRVFETVVRKNIRLAEAPSYGVPASAHDPVCPGVADYRRVAGELLRRGADAAARRPHWPGEETDTPAEVPVEPVPASPAGEPL
jgi:chromosome partitioning protein